MSKKQNPTRHFRRDTKYFFKYRITWNDRRDWYVPCCQCIHFIGEDGSELDGDYSPAWCNKKCTPIKETKAAKRPKCFHGKYFHRVKQRKLK